MMRCLRYRLSRAATVPAVAVALLFAWSPAAAQVDMSRPWTFWYWMYGAVSEDGIRADLQSMKDAGLGGCYLMPIRGVDERPEYGGRAQQLTPEFWALTDHAFRLADSLGLQMGIHICDGFALAGGPWIAPAESMQRVVWTDTIVGARSRGPLLLPRPVPDGDYYEDIAAFAVPVPEDEGTIAYDVVVPHEQPADGVPYISRNEKGVFRADSDCRILLDMGTTRTVRSMLITPSGNNIQSQRLMVEASDDGRQFRPVRRLDPPRQGWQNTDADFTFHLPATTARYLRLSWSPRGSEPGAEDLDAAKWRPNFKLKSVALYSFPLVDQFEGKCGAVWRVAPEDSLLAAADVQDRCTVAVRHIIRLNLRPDGTIVWPQGTPAGAAKHYRILRMGHASTGHTNATAGGGKGLECDKFSARAVEKQVAGWFDKFLARPHHEVIAYMHIDSWECGSQNWGTDFADQFRRRRGYDLLPLLPVYAGVPVENAERVLRDIRLTINDLVNDVFFATLHRLARERGVQLSSESVAPTMVSDGIAHYRHTDIPMGEFWLRSPTHDKPNDMLDAISGAHLYGKNLVQAEGFTEVRGTWDETPATIKPLLDLHLALGMNRLFFHVTAHNPWIDRRPGMTLDGIGLFFQRDQTWMPEARALTDYVSRSQRLLQRGVPVADIAVFTGEEMPSRAVLPHRLLPMLPGLFGAKRVAAEAARLANEDLSMEESPVGVKHSAGITTAADWVNPLRGYQYDSMNPDALLTLASVSPDGRLVLPGGASYAVLVVPQKSPMNPSIFAPSSAARDKIEAFRAAGGIVVEQPYEEADFAALGLPRDVSVPSGVAYTHRRDGARGIYFLSNQTDSALSFVCTLREQARDVSLYCPLTDRRFRAAATVSAGGTRVGVSLAPHGSMFILTGFGNEECGTWSEATPPFVSSNNSDLLPAPRPAITESPLDAAPWTVCFEANGRRITMPRLHSWTEETEDSVRYYSGRAVYETTFRLKPRNGERVVLRLGRVCDVAHVYVDGNDCGAVWTAPYEIDVTDALAGGARHTLRIVITNTWANALLGADTGHAPFGGIWTNAPYRRKETSLLPVGLLGPVTTAVFRQK